MKKLLSLLIAICGLLPLGVFAETLQLGRTGTTEIDIPQGWKREIVSGETPRGIEYEMHLTAPEGIKAKCLITLISANDDNPLSKSDYRYQVDGYSNQEASRSVEKKPSMKPWTPKNGTGEYCVLTDDWLATRETRPGQYRYEGLYFARYQNGCILIATALTDDLKSPEFQQMRQIFESIDPKLHVPRTGKIKVSKTERGTLFYTNTNATTMLVPSTSLSEDQIPKKYRGGGTSVPSYFMYIDKKQGIRISGWFFPEEDFCYADISGHWKANAPSEKDTALATPGSIKYGKSGDWDYMLYDQLISSTNMRASIIRKGTWIDLHLSTTEKETRDERRKVLIDYLASIELADKK